MIRRTTEYNRVPRLPYPHRAVVRWTLFGRVISEREFGCDEYSAYWISLPDCSHASPFTSMRLNQVRRADQFAREAQ